jgi:hypothetical protein
MKRGLCICGCGDSAVHDHHIISRQRLKRACGGDVALYARWERDRRNICRMSSGCHFGSQHNRTALLELTKLPDEAFMFAAEVLGAGPAYNALRRDYAGEDPRLDELLGLAA